MDKNRKKKLVYAGKTAWNLFEDDALKGQFDEKEMRFGVVWRELCLSDKNEYKQV